jgi:hypothetical protein
MRFRLHDADPIGLAMDWLEICKSQQVTALNELYSETAVLECPYESVGSYVGRARILEYWRPKFALPPLRPFRFEQIWPDGGGVALVYRYRDQPPTRISFCFDAAGKIERSRTIPAPSIPLHGMR